ncbi:MAG: dihydrodipicolinate synthase family protein [Spirochaetaceae bacterium]|nr:MAG: dihydrodipicolinate synthase family protein [Spirochaetaceae bacterium]
MQFEGVFPALITPFDENGELDEKKLRAFLRFLIPQVQGLYPCGSYGSGPLMTIEQRKRVAAIVMEEAAASIPVVLHVGTPDTATTIELARHAEQLGVAAVACLTPYYYLHGFNNVLEHFTRIVDSVSTPVFVYHNPKYTNFTAFTPEHLVRLAEVGVRGLKDSSASIGFFYDCISAVDDPDFTFLIGSQTILLPALVGGGHGCVSGLSNLFPRLVNRIFDFARRGDYRGALSLQRKANRLRTLTGQGIPVPFYHAALRFRDIDIGLPRSPHLPYSPNDVKRISGPIKEAIELEQSMSSVT